MCAFCEAGPGFPAQPWQGGQGPANPAPGPGPGGPQGGLLSQPQRAPQERVVGEGGESALFLGALCSKVRACTLPADASADSRGRRWRRWRRLPITRPTDPCLDKFEPLSTHDPHACQSTRPGTLLNLVTQARGVCSTRTQLGRLGPQGACHRSLKRHQSLTDQLKPRLSLSTGLCYSVRCIPISYHIIYRASTGDTIYGLLNC